MTDGLEFAQNDLFGSEKMNRKSLCVTTADQVALLDTYEGMQVYPTDTNATFHKDKLYNRNAGDTAWTENHIEETAESSLGATSSEQFVTATNLKVFLTGGLTLPTTEKFYLLTAIEGIVNAGSAIKFLMGADFISGNAASLVALCQEGTSSVGTTTEKHSCYSRVLRGGQTFWPWFWAAGAAGIGATTGSTRQSKSITYSNSVPYHHTATLTTTGGANGAQFKVYYRGYS